MALEMMKELFGVAHVTDDEEEVPNVKRMRIVEEEVLVPQGPSAAVPPKGRGCLVVVDDNGPVPPLVNSSPLFFSKNAGDCSHTFSHKCSRFVG
jgi:hypothetical protein